MFFERADLQQISFFSARTSKKVFFQRADLEKHDFEKSCLSPDSNSSQKVTSDVIESMPEPNWFYRHPGQGGGRSCQGGGGWGGAREALIDIRVPATNTSKFAVMHATWRGPQ